MQVLHCHSTPVATVCSLQTLHLWRIPMPLAPCSWFKRPCGFSIMSALLALLIRTFSMPSWTRFLCASDWAVVGCRPEELRGGLGRWLAGPAVGAPRGSLVCACTVLHTQMAGSAQPEQAWLLASYSVGLHTSTCGCTHTHTRTWNSAPMPRRKWW